MSQSWTKKGMLYCPPATGRHHKLLTHAANPLPILLEGDVYRIFYSGRDKNQRSSVGAVDIDIITGRIVQDHHCPFFEHGPAGSFYADGVSIGNCYEADGKRYMLFMGWQNPPNEHWRGDIGRLVVERDLTLSLDNKQAFLGANAVDPISLSYPWVIKGQDGYRMWYGSTAAWETENGEMLHVINSASSADGNHWTREGLSIPYELGRAQAFSRPTVLIRNDGSHEMWFSFRSGSGQRYRIGHAVSADGNNWTLSLDTAGIDIGPEEWDSEMIEYPFVFEHREEYYMLYNGNGYGKTGFGLASMTKEKK